MNVKDFEHIQIPDGDMLGMIFTAQAVLIERYHNIEKGRGAIVVEPQNYGKLDNRFLQWRLKDLAFRCIEELTEATNTLKNKPWKQSEVPTDAVHFYEEVADALHFFIEFCITAGMSAEDLARVYHRKHAVNQFRVESKY